MQLTKYPESKINSELQYSSTHNTQMPEYCNSELKLPVDQRSYTFWRSWQIKKSGATLAKCNQEKSKRENHLSEMKIPVQTDTSTNLAFISTAEVTRIPKNIRNVYNISSSIICKVIGFLENAGIRHWRLEHSDKKLKWIRIFFWRKREN